MYPSILAFTSSRTISVHCWNPWPGHCPSKQPENYWRQTILTAHLKISVSLQMKVQRESWFCQRHLGIEFCLCCNLKSSRLRCKVTVSLDWWTRIANCSQEFQMVVYHWNRWKNWLPRSHYLIYALSNDRYKIARNKNKIRITFINYFRSRQLYFSRGIFFILLFHFKYNRTFTTPCSITFVMQKILKQKRFTIFWRYTLFKSWSL